MFQSDIHLVFFILSLNNFLLAAVLFHITKITKGKVNGVDYWVYGTLLSGTGLLIAAFFKNDVSLTIEFVLSLGLNVCILVGDVLFIFGLLRFKSKPLNHIYWLFPVLSIINIIWFTLIERQIAARFFINAILPAIFYVLIAIEFLKPYKKEFRTSFVIAGSIFIFYSVIHIIRIISALSQPFTQVIPNDTITVLIVLIGGLSMVLYTYILILIITKTLTMALNEQIQNRDKLYAIISHDLMGPVGTILNYAEIIRTSIHKWTPEKTELWLKNMESAALGSRFLLENLFSWSRSQLEEIKVNAKDNNIVETIQLVLVQIQGNATNKEIEIHFKQDKPINAFFDADMIAIVVRNLLSNAIKFTPKGGRIDISVEEKETYIEIIIADTGVGMTSEKIKQIMEKVLIETTYGTANEKGRGFGLLLCRDFVRLNHGSLSIESEVGRGTVFRVKLNKTYNEKQK